MWADSLRQLLEESFNLFILELQVASGFPQLSIGNCKYHPPQGVHTPLLGLSDSDPKRSMKFRSSSGGLKPKRRQDG